VSDAVQIPWPMRAPGAVSPAPTSPSVARWSDRFILVAMKGWCPGMLRATLCGALLAASDCGDLAARPCTLIGCGATASLKLSVAGTLEDLRRSSVGVCQNQLCFSGSFAASEDVPSATQGVGLRLPSEAEIEAMPSGHADVVVWDRGTGQLDIEVTWTAREGDDLRPGDAYLATVTSPDPQFSVSDTEVASRYSVSYPNGKECGPACQTAVLASP
jgi:hypothetical protein